MRRRAAVRILRPLLRIGTVPVRILRMVVGPKYGPFGDLPMNDKMVDLCFQLLESVGELVLASVRQVAPGTGVTWVLDLRHPIGKLMSESYSGAADQIEEYLRLAAD